MSNIKVSLGDIWVGIEDIRLLVASEWPIVRNREAVVTVSSGDEEYRLRNATDAVAALSKRAEKAEKERDEAKATLETYRSVAGVAERTAEELRERLLEVEKELDAAIRERDDAQAALARVLPRACGACEGPLTCARCTVSDQVLAEAERLGARSIDH